MVRAVKEVIEVPNENKGFHNLIVAVNAGGSEFIECYVGVDKSSKFWSGYNDITYRDKRHQIVENQAFKKFGSKKEFNSFREISNMMPIDGAWLTFARSGKTYDFLKDDFFYYGSGFCIKPGHKYCNEENCREAAKVQLDRMFMVINQEHPDLEKAFEADENDIWDIIQKSDYYGKTYHSWIGGSRPICCTEIRREVTKLFLYEFDQELNQKIWQIQNTAIFVRADGTIFEKIKYDETFPYNHFSSFEKAVIYRASKESLHSSDIEKLRDRLGDYSDAASHAGYYWSSILEKAAESKLNKNERSNLEELLQNLKERKLKHEMNLSKRIEFGAALENFGLDEEELYSNLEECQLEIELPESFYIHFLINPDTNELIFEHNFDIKQAVPDELNEFKERMNYFIANGYNDIDIIQDIIYGIMAKYHFDDILFIQYGTKRGIHGY